MDLQQLEARFQRFMAHQLYNHTFHVVETCRLDNAHILPLNRFKELRKHFSLDSVVGFIPAAGAATRYLEPLKQLAVQGLEENDLQRILTERRWLLPVREEKETWREWLSQMASTPKAFFPCAWSGETFLDLKCLELQAIGLKQTVFVSPEGYVEGFVARSHAHTQNFSVQVFAQDASMKTPRISAQGHVPSPPYKIEQLAPAGHGSLIQLFARTKICFPEARALFIMNIDNVIGTSQKAVEISQQFLCFYENVRVHVQTIRQALEHGEWGKAEHSAQNILSCVGEDARVIVEGVPPALAHVLFSLLGCPTSLYRNNLLELYQRPLVFMGQVPREPGDVGGTPIMTDLDGHRVRLCVEGPHLSQEAKDKIFGSAIVNKAATHFNPVFVACELLDADAYQKPKDPFWLFAKKRWGNEDVYYHESILYEIIGNSLRANVLFVEIPRILFRPHKTFEDVHLQSSKA
jgi:hypothetical protein